MATKTTSSEPISSVVPHLEPGDHLTRDEFERRYEAMPQVKKAELMDGVVYIPSPVRLDQHASPHAALMLWLSYYWARTPAVRVGANPTVRLDLDSEPQPDAVMIRQPSHGGRVVIGPRGYVEGGPELVGEVAASTASFDLHTKLRVYRRNHVQEYVVWRVDDQRVDWFVLRNEEYIGLPPTTSGIHQSEVFPGLWLDADALVRLDLARMLDVLQEGIASPEHAAFVAELQRFAAQAAPESP
jgi:Uma2 family endonuclease